VWYDDATLHTYSLSDLKFTDGKPYIDNPLGNQVGLYTNPGNKNLFLDSSRLFVFKISGGQLMPVDLQELAQRKSN